MNTFKKHYKKHRFTLVFSVGTELTRKVRDAFFEAGCDDALLGMRNGEVFLDFDRRAKSFREALLSALADVDRAGLGAEIERVESNE